MRARISIKKCNVLLRYVPLGPRPATTRAKAGADEKTPFNPGGGVPKVLNKPLPAPYIEDPYETKQLLAKKEFQVSGGGRGGRWRCGG